METTTTLKIGVRAEDKNPWERRTPLMPEALAALQTKGVDVTVQTSGQRAIADAEFEAAGVPVRGDLKDRQLVMGIKEIPPEKIAPETVYCLFAHVIKGQSYNMPMLSRLIAVGATLIDYERIADSQNRRLVFFGRHAGLAGMINTLWALGLRLSHEGLASPFKALRQARHYGDLVQAKQALEAVGAAIADQGLPKQLHPLVVGITGYGNVARGAEEVLDLLPVKTFTPAQLVAVASSPESLSPGTVYKVVFKEADIVAPNDPLQRFDLTDYYANGHQKYHSVFTPYLSLLTLLVNCNYWDDRYPRLVTREDCLRLWGRGRNPKLKVIGDLACDVDGAVACTRKAACPDRPLYCYEPTGDQVSDGVVGDGPVVMAVEILPTELPYESSRHFSRALSPYLMDLVTTDYHVPFDDLALPEEIKRAVIVYRGELTPHYRYLDAHLNPKEV